MRNRTMPGLAGLGALLLAVALPAAPAAAHDGTSHGWKEKRAEYVAGVSVPVVSTPNIRLVTSVPDVSAISGCFLKSAPHFVVSSLDAITVLDVRDPLAPKITGVLPNAVFENEAMSCGERTEDGVTTRFVLVGVDGAQASPDDVSHVGTANEFLVVDVTDPAKPFIRSRVQTTSSTHTVTCVQDTDCRYVYTAGGDHFSIVDMADLDAPEQVATAVSPAAGWAGHRWDFDAAGLGTHTGAGGAAVFDVTDPVHPRLVATTDESGTAPGWNDFILHNSQRPNATKFTPGTEPSVENGNVLLVTEEDYVQTDCTQAGSFESWHVESLDGTPGSIHALDRINPVDPGEGVALPHEAFCSAHWFDYHQSGIIAQGYYQGGLRLIDVRDPRNLKEYGYVASGLSEVWDAYWVPERNRNGIATDRKTNIVYTADLIRGVDVYTVDVPGGDDGTEVLPPLALSSGGIESPLLALSLLLTGLAGSVVVRRATRA